MIKFIFISTFIDGLAQEYNISIASGLEILQSCTKPSIYRITRLTINNVYDYKEPCRQKAHIIITEPQ